MRIIANEGGIASGKIYNIGNPTNNYSIRELAEMMLKLAAEYPEYAESAKKVKLIETTSAAYYGQGYQDVQNRVPKIANTCEELKWNPVTSMQDTLRNIFDAYRSHVVDAKALMD
jgi:nucleoside-diphosphate-sugar epimerase